MIAITQSVACVHANNRKAPGTDHRMGAHTQQHTSMFPGSVFHIFVKYNQELCPGNAQDPEIMSNKDGLSQTKG